MYIKHHTPCKPNWTAWQACPSHCTNHGNPSTPSLAVGRQLKCKGLVLTLRSTPSLGEKRLPTIQSNVHTMIANLCSQTRYSQSQATCSEHGITVCDRQGSMLPRVSSANVHKATIMTTHACITGNRQHTPQPLSCYCSRPNPWSTPKSQRKNALVKEHTPSIHGEASPDPNRSLL